MSTIAAQHPAVLIDHSGGILSAWYVQGNPSDPTDTTHGTLKGTFQNPGDASPSASFTFQFWNGTALAPLVVQDDVFQYSAAYEGQARYNLVVLIAGESDVSYWYSADGGRTWTRVTGTGGGTEVTPYGVDDGTF